MKLAIIGLLILGAGGAALWQAGIFDEATELGAAQGGTFVVRRGDLMVMLTERGTLKTLNAAQVRSEVEGRTPIQWLAEEGKTVKKGEIVIELDKTETELEVENRRNLIIQLESEEKAARTEQLIQEEQNKTDLEKADLALEVARAELAKLMEGDIPTKERELELAIITATSERDRAEDRFKEMPTMQEKGFITADQFEDERIKLRKAREALTTANQNKELYLKYQKPLDIRQKEAKVTEAERGVIRARNQAEARLEGKKAQVSQKERRLSREKQKLEEDLADLAKMTIRASADGTIFYGNPDNSWEAEEIKVGNNAYYNNILMTIPDPTEMAVVINIHEADISKLKVGTPATIRSETNKGKSYDGIVAKIAKVANAGNRRWGDQIRRFRVEVKIQGSELDLKPGTSASVEVNIGELNDVVHVPLQAVHPKEGQFTCYVETPAGPEEKVVGVGRSNDAFLEITEGLKEGDKVLLYSPEPGTVKGDPAAKGDSGRSGKDGSMRGKGRGKPSGSGPGRPGGRGRPQT